MDVQLWDQISQHPHVDLVNFREERDASRENLYKVPSVLTHLRLKFMEFLHSGASRYDESPQKALIIDQAHLTLLMDGYRK